jgi:amino acid adenylation domain-containing protein
MPQGRPGRAAAANGGSGGLPEPVLQYADFAAWQRQELTGGTLADLLRHWRERLAAPLPVLELPTDRPRPPVQTHRGARLALAFEPRLVTALRTLAADSGATLFMVLLAGFQTLLLRHSGQDDLVVGTPVAGRNRAELERLIGPFVNTLALRCSLAGDPPVAALIEQVRQVCLDGFRHQDLPFEKLVEELGVERSLGHSPLFAVMLALQNAAPPPLALPGLVLERLPADSGTAKFDLTVDLTEHRHDGSLAGAIEYNTDLFDRATIARLAGHLGTLLAGLAELSELSGLSGLAGAAGLVGAALSTGAGTAPGARFAAPPPLAARLSALPLLAAAERHQLTAEVNDSRAPFASGAVIQDLFAASARRLPDAVAVSCAGRCLSYGALAAEVERLARRLVRLGVGPEILVGIHAERSPALVVAVLAVLSAGGAYLPLDPTYPPARVGDILADSGARLLLGERALAATLPATAARVVLLDEAPPDEVPLAREPAGAPPRWPTPDNLAYVIYTSGSTGRPKGVELRHRGVVNYLASMARRPGLGEDAVMMALTTLSFDIAVTELLLPLAIGARIELVRRETAAEAARLAAAVEEAGATIMQATPTTWALLLDGGWAGRPGLVALCGGEALPPGLAARLLPRVAALWNVYGPTETTVWSTLHRLAADPPGTRPVPVGRPLANTVVELLDRTGNLAPLGVAAELAIGGEGLARGYRGRPDLTAERFIPDAAAGGRGEPGARLYRTGDLARRRPDGDLECLGRIDSQVKVRGVRIELGEIEAAAAAHPAVRGCVTGLLRGERPADARLVAWVVREPGGTLSWEELRGHLLQWLPAAMVPSAAVFLERLPLLPSGKVDRRSLPAPGHERPDLAASYASPQNERERAVAQLWQEALGLERVGIHDNFFDLGGHSLLAAEIHGRLREQLGADLALVDLFRYPTVHALAARLAGGDGDAAPLAEVIAQSGAEREALRRRRRGLAQRRQPATPPGGGTAS